jgi:prepilin-type N-terminal cleavage/methylation domain-containing protein
MTLVELMIVVVIIGILAAIAVVGYSKYRKNARVSEASAILAEFSAKEQLYFLDNGQYSEAHRSSANYPSENDDANQFFPHDPTVDWDSGSQAFAVNPLPDTWRRLGIRPRWPQLFCTYIANAGCPNGSDPGGKCNTMKGFVGPRLFAGVPNVHWFYVIGACNLIGKAGWPNVASSNHVTMLSLTHDSAALSRDDETD